MADILDAATLGRLRRLRLQQRHRVEGRYAGTHKARGHGASLDFADYREYVAGDDPRRVDVHAYARLGRRLVKLYEAEDEAALRVVVDLSASMRFGRKAEATRQAAAALSIVAAVGGDRARLVLAGDEVDPGPWFRGPAAVPWLQQRLASAQASGQADLEAAVVRAVREGPTGPVALVSDLLDERWEAVLRTLSTNRGDAVLVHLVGREDLEPTLDGDLRIVDAERGDEIEIGMAGAVPADYVAARDAWLRGIADACRRGGIVNVQVVDDEAVPVVLTQRLLSAGVLA